MTSVQLSREMELRHVPTQQQLRLVKVLDTDDSILSLLMSNIVKNLDNPTESELKFSSADVQAVREHAHRHNKSSILVLLDEWSTMGRARPKVKDLFNLLVKCQLYEGADFLSDILGETRPERPQNGPAARVDISLNEDIEQVVEDLQYPFSTIDINKNNFAKPAIVMPNIVNFIENGGPSTVVPDLIEFSKTLSTLRVSSSFESSFLPATLNSENLNLNNIPALSGLVTSDGVDSFNIPAVVGSMSSDEAVPDLSGLMNQNDKELTVNTFSTISSESSYN
jgi:Tube Death domain